MKNPDLDYFFTPAYSLIQPKISPQAVIFDIPRSGREYPSDFQVQASFMDLHSSVSRHLETLYENVVDHGASWLYARFPNLYIDANRHEKDIDPDTIDGVWPEELLPSAKTKAGIGLIPQVVRANVPIYTGKLQPQDIAHRLTNFYWAYHHQLAELLAQMRKQSEQVFHLSCHSMGSLDPSARCEPQLRSEFDLGDRDGTTASVEFVHFLRHTLEDMGYTVSINRHFKGAEAIRKHANPAQGIHSVQIEMRRNLYMNEKTGEQNADYGKTQANMTRLAQAIGEFSAAHKG